MRKLIDKCLSPITVQNVAYKIIYIIFKEEENERYRFKIKREKGRKWCLG